MIFEQQGELRDRIEELSGRRIRGRVEIFEDTSSYMGIFGGSVMRLAGSDYFVMGDTFEGRFGMEDQPKFWVKHVLHLGSGVRKIVKLVFDESFYARLGGIKIKCRRSPEKEGAFLECVRGQERFMQGFSVRDSVGNLVRIIDFIQGPSLYNHLYALEVPHEVYYHETLPGLAREVACCIEAMAGVHRAGLHHGDIRNDHLLVERESGRLVWIDFDYEVNFSDYDIWSMGNVLTFMVGKGIHTFHDVAADADHFPLQTAPLGEHDALVFYRYRVANLRKLFPYVAPELNDMLLRFSVGAVEFYADLASQARDLRAIFAS